MSDQVFGAGRNIKCHDKLKIQNLKLKCRLHAQNKYYREGSLNQIVSCHRGRNDSDWFVVRNAGKGQLSPNYIFKSGDIIVLTHMKTNKNIHAAQEYDSPISIQCEVSACMNYDPSNCCYQDQWKVEVVDGQDEYWRVGDVVKFLNVKIGKHLSTHKKELQQNKEYEVFVPKSSGGDGAQGEAKNPEWIVCEQQAYIYTAPIVSDPNKIKRIQDLDELAQLKEIKRRQNKQKKQTSFEKTEEKKIRKTLQQYNNVLTRQVETNKLKFRERSCWKKYLCCCFHPEPDSEQGYLQLT